MIDDKLSRSECETFLKLFRANNSVFCLGLAQRPIPDSFVFNCFPTSEDILVHATKGGVHKGGNLTPHQVVSRGSFTALQRLLALLSNRLGAEKVAQMLNTAVGKQDLGALDLALRSNLGLCKTLRDHGALEQAAAPKDWKKNRRAHSSSAFGYECHRTSSSRAHQEPYWTRWPRPEDQSQGSAASSSQPQDDAWQAWRQGRQNKR